MLFLGETRVWNLRKHRWKNNKSLFEQEEALSKDQTHMGAIWVEEDQKGR